MQVKKLKQNAILPERANSYAAGYDLYLPSDTSLEIGLNKVHIGIEIQIPHGHYGRIACRSSLAKGGMTVEAGVIDEDYRGEIMVLLRVREQIELRRCWKIAQIIITPYATPEIIQVDELGETERGSGGFGSTDN